MRDCKAFFAKLLTFCFALLLNLLEDFLTYFDGQSVVLITTKNFPHKAPQKEIIKVCLQTCDSQQFCAFQMVLPVFASLASHKVPFQP